MHAEETDFVLEILAHVHAAVIVTKPHAPGCAGGERSELLAYRLPDRLQRFEAMRILYGVDPETFGRAVIDCGEDRYLSVLLRERRGRTVPHSWSGLPTTMVPACGFSGLATAARLGESS